MASCTWSMAMITGSVSHPGPATTETLTPALVQAPATLEHELAHAHVHRLARHGIGVAELEATGDPRQELEHGLGVDELAASRAHHLAVAQADLDGPIAVVRIEDAGEPALMAHLQRARWSHHLHVAGHPR